MRVVQGPVRNGFPKPSQLDGSRKTSFSAPWYIKGASTTEVVDHRGISCKKVPLTCESRLRSGFRDDNAGGGNLNLVTTSFVRVFYAYVKIYIVKYSFNNRLVLIIFLFGGNVYNKKIGLSSYIRNFNTRDVFERSILEYKISIKLLLI